MIQISEKYGIDFDKYNIILREKYEKREGKGKNAPLSGEFDYRDVNFHVNLYSVADTLRQLNVSESEINSFEEWADKLEALKNEIAEYLNEGIDIAAEKKKVEETRARKGD